MRTAWLPTLALVVLAPVCAEYLWGYDVSTGDPLVLLGNLLVFAPLYGCPALLIREVARRCELGWPGILLLAAAFGIVQAGLVDQSMFSTNYRDIPYWEEMSQPTYVAPIGLSVYLVLAFVGGHVVNSIGAPIALVEGLAGGRRHAPWLGKPMIVVAGLLYATASALVLNDTLATEEDHASVGQLAGAFVAVALLVGAAFVVDRRAPRPRRGRVPDPWLVALGGFAAMGAAQLMPTSPLGTAGFAAVDALTVAVVWRLSRRPGWGATHAAGLAAGALVAAGTIAFLATPLGDVSDTAKYAHNIALLLLVAGLGAAAVRRARSAGPAVADVPA